MTKQELTARIFHELRAYMGAAFATKLARKIVGMIEEYEEDTK